MKKSTEAVQKFVDRVIQFYPDLTIKKSDKINLFKLLLMDEHLANNVGFSMVLSNAIISAYTKLVNGRSNCFEFSMEIMELLEKYLFSEINLMIEEKKSDMLWDSFK